MNERLKKGNDTKRCTPSLSLATDTRNLIVTVSVAVGVFGVVILVLLDAVVRV